MISKMATFDPSAPSTVPIVNTLQGEQGFLLVWNESMISITINYFNYSRLCPAGTFTVIALDQAVPQFTWSQALVFPNVGQAPASLVYIEGATIDEADYIGRMTYPMPLPRLSNIGNQVSTTGTNSVINDGQAVGTQVVEGTPTGASGSQLLLLNDGTGKLGNGNLLMNATQLSAQNGYTFDTTKLSTAALPAGVTIGATQLTSGALPAGVTIGATQLTSGALPAGVTLAGSQLTAGAAPASVELGTSSTLKVSAQNVGGYTGAIGVINSGGAVWLCGEVNVAALVNLYFDGTNYRQLGGTANTPAQLLFDETYQGGSLPRLALRYSTNQPGAGNVIAGFSALEAIPLWVDTSSRTPIHIWTGTGTPSGQNAGDFWIKA